MYRRQSILWFLSPCSCCWLAAACSLCLSQQLQPLLLDTQHLLCLRPAHRQEDSHSEVRRQNTVSDSLRSDSASITKPSQVSDDEAEENPLPRVAHPARYASAFTCALFPA